MLERFANEVDVFPLPCSSDSMQSADDDTTAPLRPTEFNLQVRQLKSTKTGDAESFTVGAAAAIAAEKRPRPTIRGRRLWTAKGRARVEQRTIHPAWPARVGIPTQRHSVWSAIPCKPRLCCISDHLPSFVQAAKEPSASHIRPFPLIVGSRFYLVRSSLGTLPNWHGQLAGQPARGLNTDTPGGKKLS